MTGLKVSVFTRGEFLQRLVFSSLIKTQHMPRGIKDLIIINKCWRSFQENLLKELRPFLSYLTKAVACKKNISGNVYIFEGTIDYRERVIFSTKKKVWFLSAKAAVDINAANREIFSESFKPKQIWIIFTIFRLI